MVAKFFIGGIAPQTTEDDMRQHFEQFGQLVDVAVMRDPAGVPRCFGFVEYADPNGHSCQPYDDHIICNKKVDVKAAVPKEAIEQGTPSRTNKIFVGGLSPASTADSVLAAFSQFGAVTRVDIKADPAGQPRGFCFVEFDSDHGADLACATQPMFVDDQQVNCKLARPMGKGKGFGKGGGFGFGGGFGGGFAGPMRTNYFAAARPSPYGSPYGGRGGYAAPATRYAAAAPAYGRPAYAAAPAPARYAYAPPAASYAAPATYSSPPAYGGYRGGAGAAYGRYP